MIFHHREVAVGHIMFPKKEAFSNNLIGYYSPEFWLQFEAVQAFWWKQKIFRSLKDTPATLHYK